MEIDAERLRLARDAGFVSLKEVAARQIADESDLDVTIVERRRSAG
jgi:molybdate-binding protein